MFGFGELITPTHLIFVVAVSLFIFGPKRLPEIGRGLGKGLREFKDSIAGIEGEKPADAEPKTEKPRN